MVAWMETHRARVVVGHEASPLADDDAFPVPAGQEVVRFHHHRDISVGHDRDRHVVQAAAEPVALNGGYARRVRAQKVSEEIKEMDGVALGHPDVGARALEAGEAARGVPHAADAIRIERLAYRDGDGMEAEDVADLQHPSRRAGHRRELTAVVHRQRQRLLDKAVPAGPQRVARHGEVTVRGGDHVDGVHVLEGLPVVGDRVRRGHASLHRQCATSRADVGDPHRGADLAEDTQVLLAPASETDEQHVHRG
jgi:hypothetical protein